MVRYLDDMVRAGLEPHRAAIEAQAVRVELDVPEDLEVHFARSRVERVISTTAATCGSPPDPAKAPPSASASPSR